MRKQSTFLKNAWYAAALTSDLGPESLFNRRIMEIPIVFYRKRDGSPVALHDRCPHRFAPLHLGKRVGDEIACGYHALRFDCSGACTHNPHGQGQLPPAKVRSFPLLERFGFIWIWMGEQAPDSTKLPDFGELEAGHPNGVAYTYMHMKANYELIIDNVMDLSHIDHVHGEIISTRGQLSPLTPAIRESPTSIAARWEWKQTPAMLIFNSFLPDPAGEARGFFDITWTAPANIQLSVGAVQDPNASLDLKGCVGQYDLHTCTPESSTTTHYFFATRRNHHVEDGDYNQGKIQAMHTAFETEDGPIIEAVDREMGTDDFFSLHPILMSNDLAPVKVRRLLRRMIQAECVA